MRTSFEVRQKTYEAEISPVERPEGEKFATCQVTVRTPEATSVKGTLKLTEAALQLVAERADKEGSSLENHLARGCARSLAAEVLIRKLKPDFSFVVDHRWVG